MPERVDFYLLQSAGEDRRFACACKIAAKAYQQGLNVFLRVADRARAEALDNLLWSYNPVSFIPHGIADQKTDYSSIKVLISDQPAPPDWNQLLISLTDEVPADSGQFDRIADLISDDPDDKVSGRKRFKQYRQLGIEPTTHHIPG